MVLSLGQHDRRAPGFEGADDVVQDEGVPSLVAGKQPVDDLDRTAGIAARELEACLSNDQPARERTCGRRRLPVGDIARRAELHLKDRMLSVAAFRRRRQPGHVARPDLGEHPLERDGGDVMAFIHHHVTVAGHQIGDDVLAHQTLDRGDVDHPVTWRFPPPIRPMDLGSTSRNIASCAIHWSRRGCRCTSTSAFLALFDNQQDAGHRLADARRSDQDSDVVGQQRANRGLLKLGRRATEAVVDGLPGFPLVIDVEHRARDPKQGGRIVRASSWERHVSGEILGAGDDARRQRSRKPHGLLAVELRIAEGGKALEGVENRRRQTGLVDKQPLRQGGFDPGRDRLLDRWRRRYRPPRRREKPGLRHAVLFFHTA